MKNFKTGQAVRLNHEIIGASFHKANGEVLKTKGESYIGPGTILHETKEKGYWSVIFQEESNSQYSIRVLHESKLKPYKNNCWQSNCNGTVDSSIHSSCSKCGWVICPECQSCQRTTCKPRPFNIKGIPIRLTT